MKSIFKHPEKIDISSIADNEASKITSFLFKIHKSFCGNCKKVFNDYQTLGLKIAKSFDKKLINKGSERIFNFYSVTLKAAVYALVVGVTFSSVGIAFAQTQTDVDIIPDVTFFEDGEIISFSEEEVENLFTEVIDPIQATLITFIEPDEITVDEVVIEIEDQVEVLTTLVPEDVVTEEEPVVTEEEPVVTEEEPVVTEEEPVVTEEEPVVTEEVSELTGLQNALNQVEQNIALAIQNNNENALNGLENAKEKILENIEKAEEKLQKGNEKAEEKLQKGNEKAKKEIEEAKEKADKILAKVDPSSDEKEVVKAQLKAERTLQKAEEKAQKEIEKAQKEAEKELEKAQKEAQEETVKAQKESEKAEKKAQKESEKKDK
jgi:tetratricopeptide (TPR) repeat protein